MSESRPKLSIWTKQYLLLLVISKNLLGKQAGSWQLHWAGHQMCPDLGVYRISLDRDQCILLGKEAGLKVLCLPTGWCLSWFCCGRHRSSFPLLLDQSLLGGCRGRQFPCSIFSNTKVPTSNCTLGRFLQTHFWVSPLLRGFALATSSQPFLELVVFNKLQINKFLGNWEEKHQREMRNMEKNKHMKIHVDL